MGASLSTNKRGILRWSPDQHRLLTDAYEIGGEKSTGTDTCPVDPCPTFIDKEKVPKSMNLERKIKSKNPNPNPNANANAKAQSEVQLDGHTRTGNSQMKLLPPTYA